MAGTSSAASVSSASHVERERLPDGRYLGISWYGIPGGLPVLYFHGTPSSRVEASLIAADCSTAGIQLISIDRPGIGSSSPHRSHSVRRWAADIRALTDRLSLSLGTNRFGLLTYSGGTPFALAAARFLPDRIPATAIMAPRVPGAPGVPSGVLDRDVFRVRRNPRIASWVMRSYRRRLQRSGAPPRRTVVDRLSAGDRAFAQNNYHWLKESYLEATRCGVDGIIRDTSLMIWPWSLDLSRIETPVALWQGTHDHSAPVATSHFLQRRIPNCHLTIANPEGHLTLYKNRAADALAWLHDQLAPSAALATTAPRPET